MSILLILVLLKCKNNSDLLFKNCTKLNTKTNLETTNRSRAKMKEKKRKKKKKRENKKKQVKH